VAVKFGPFRGDVFGPSPPVSVCRFAWLAVGTKVALLWGMKTTRCTICKTEGNHERYSYWTRPRAVCSSCHLANYSGQINAGYLNGKRLTDEQRRAFSVVVKP